MDRSVKLKKYGTLHFRWKDVHMTAKLFSLNQNKTTNELEIGHMAGLAKLESACGFWFV